MNMIISNRHSLPICCICPRTSLHRRLKQDKVSRFSLKSKLTQIIPECTGCTLLIFFLMDSLLSFLFYQLCGIKFCLPQTLNPHNNPTPNLHVSRLTTTPVPMEIMNCGNICAARPAAKDQWAIVGCKTKTKPTNSSFDRNR